MSAFGIPLFFFLPLIVHVLVALTTGAMGVMAFSVRKRRGRHFQWRVC